MSFDEWYTKDISLKIDKLRLRKDGGYSAAKMIWNAAQSNVEKYTQSEIDSWNAQGGSFSQWEIDNAKAWK